MQLVLNVEIFVRSPAGRTTSGTVEASELESESFNNFDGCTGPQTACNQRVGKMPIPSQSRNVPILKVAPSTNGMSKVKL